jgi:hypothetical protein
METPNAERLERLAPFAQSVIFAYLKAKKEANITDDELAVILGGIIGFVAVENEIRSGTGKALEIVFSALRTMMPMANPEYVAQVMRERLSEAGHPPTA